MRLRDLLSAALAQIVGNCSFVKAGLVNHAATKTALITAATVQFNILGKAYSQAAITAAQSLVTTNLDGDTAAAMTVPASGGTAYFAVGLNSSGAMKTRCSLGDLPTGRGHTGKMPRLPSDIAPIGYVKVVTTSAAFVPGTTDLDTASGMTITFVDCGRLPFDDAP